jgi:hypothetical protein
MTREPFLNVGCPNSLIGGWGLKRMQNPHLRGFPWYVDAMLVLMFEIRPYYEAN